jgi:two-component system NarL family response regulator
MINVLLVDDHALFREGLVSLLNRQSDFRVIGQAGTVQDAIKMARELKPDLVLMDFSLPDGTGLDATQAILSTHPDCDIVFLTVYEEDDRLFAAIRSGAKGYLLKNVPVAKLLEFLRGVEQGEAAITRAMASRVLDEFARLEPRPKHYYTGADDLTTRELEVLQELATGASNREIAESLSITENTVRNHVHNILTKLGLKNRREAANIIRR